MAAGDVGLEIAPGSEVENQSLIEDVGNAWNHVPVAREWTPLDPKYEPQLLNMKGWLSASSRPCALRLVDMFIRLKESGGLCAF